MYAPNVQIFAETINLFRLINQKKDLDKLRNKTRRVAKTTEKMSFKSSCTKRNRSMRNEKQSALTNW